MADTLDPRALEALKNNQRQLDADGCEVAVSRQALDEVIAAFEASTTALIDLKADRDFWQTTFQTETRARIALSDELAELKTARLGLTPAAPSGEIGELVERLRDPVPGNPQIRYKAAAKIEELAAALRAAGEREAELRKKLDACQWYWPEDDTGSENCAGHPAEVVEAQYGWCTPTGEVVAVARGGIVEVTYCASLPPADDSDSDDEFWVEEATEEAAIAKIKAELDRRALLATRNTGGGDE